ncbi:MAG: peptidoglycan DD-metalloendopeptidase family protein [Acidobacteriota bacterium]
MSIQGLPPNPLADSFTQAAARFEGRVREGGRLGVQETAAEFESLFISYLLKVMRETIQESGLFEGSPGKDVYAEMFDQELAKVMGQRGVLGIGDLLLRQLEHRPASETAPHAPALPGPGAVRAEPPAVSSSGQGEVELPVFSPPLQARISSFHGQRRDPFTGQARFHKGIDLAAPEGTKVLAALAGRVVHAGREGGYGNTVVVEHPNGYCTRYAHLATLEVRPGDILQTQQLLGTVGSTGRSTGPHLHFEITRDGETMDPRSALTD